MKILSNLWRIFKLLFALGEDKADESMVIDGIKSAVNFRGAKLWVLILAILVASLGLNTNSTAVIIGAMLISPLMGPIIGMGLSVGISDFELFRRSLRNYVVATVFSILTATLYFAITPIDLAQSELLARTSPTIYDVFIALSGGLAGIIALGSKSQRTGNVIPGVAIATALMPPLCTTGFGLATTNWLYALGAFYLFLINTVFIALATYFGAHFVMKFKKVVFLNSAQRKRVNRYITIVSIAVIIPSVFITIHIASQTMYESRAQEFINKEINFNDTHIIGSTINFDRKLIEVILIGNEIDTASINAARSQLSRYDLDGTALTIIQNNVNLSDKNKQANLKTLVATQDHLIKRLQNTLKPYDQAEKLSSQLYPELKILFPEIKSITVSYGRTLSGIDTLKTDSTTLIVINTLNPLPSTDTLRINSWLRQRASTCNIKIIYT